MDCGFLAQALLRAPNELWKKLDAATQKNLAAGLSPHASITPGQNNWLLFAATVEAALAMMGERFDAMRIDYAVRAHQQWYVGDGLYGDGPRFHWDYYNSFVIQPMLLDVLRNIGAHAKTWQPLLPDILARARRYAAIQERLISPEGTFPVIGRSICYRTGAFQLLAQIALLGELPAPLTGPRVRAALTAVMKRLLEAPGTFDDKGWLTVGFAGTSRTWARATFRPAVSTFARRVFLPLGLPPADAVLERTGGRLDVAPHVARRRCPRRPRDHGLSPNRLFGLEAAHAGEPETNSCDLAQRGADRSGGAGESRKRRGNHGLRGRDVGCPAGDDRRPGRAHSHRRTKRETSKGHGANSPSSSAMKPES